MAKNIKYFLKNEENLPIDVFLVKYTDDTNYSTENTTALESNNISSEYVDEESIYSIIEDWTTNIFNV